MRDLRLYQCLAEDTVNIERSVVFPRGPVNDSEMSHHLGYGL